MADSVRKEMLKTMSVLMTTAFAFVAGAAWNGAIQAIIEGDAVWSLLIYAIIVTIIAVIATLCIGRLIARAGVEIDE